jgi:hypothetical protein
LSFWIRSLSRRRERDREVGGRMPTSARAACVPVPRQDPSAPAGQDGGRPQFIATRTGVGPSAGGRQWAPTWCHGEPATVRRLERTNTRQADDAEVLSVKEARSDAFLRTQLSVSGATPRAHERASRRRRGGTPYTEPTRGTRTTVRNQSPSP